MWILCLVILILVIFLVVCLVWNKPIDIKKEVTKTLGTIDKIFNKHNIWYVGAFGTLLGTIRHWDMIPWDDDGDIIVMRKDVDDILLLKDEFKNEGYIMEYEWKLIKIYPNANKYPFVDIFIFDNIDEKAARCHEPYNEECVCKVSKDAKWWWNDVGFPFEWLKKRHRAKYGNIKIWIPDKAVQMLKYWYGTNVLTTCKTHTYDHIKMINIPSREIACVNLPPLQLERCDI